MLLDRSTVSYTIIPFLNDLPSPSDIAFQSPGAPRHHMWTVDNFSSLLGSRYLPEVQLQSPENDSGLSFTRVDFQGM